MGVQVPQAPAHSKRFSRFAIPRNSGPAGRYSLIFNTSGNLAEAFPSRQAKERCRTRQCGAFGRRSIFESFQGPDHKRRDCEARDDNLHPSPRVTVVRLSLLLGEPRKPFFSAFKLRIDLEGRVIII